jgi:hypothetical protein
VVWLFGAGYLPVLASFAMKVAAPAAQGKDQCAGVEMEDGLLFDGINGKGGDLGVIQVVEPAFVVAVHLTDTELTRVNAAAPLAGAAPHQGTGKLLVQQCFVHPLNAIISLAGGICWAG